MDFKNIPITAYPAYTWLWNSTITKEGIKQQIDEMYASGIRAFYALGEPENFRPNRRRTHLSPEYLSEEYLDLLFYAFSYAKEKGMYTWLYNEGGFPSGMVCGKIRDEHPELAKKVIKVFTVKLRANEQYEPAKNSLAAFVGEERIKAGDSFAADTDVTEYRYLDDPDNIVQSDNASLRNTEIFLEMTHEKIKRCFGAHFGTDVTLMFDDEAYMGDWTDGLDRLFYDRYGYDMTDFLPYIMKVLEPKTPEQYRAVSDYFMLCGDIVRDNYFIPMRDWLRKNRMCSTGHLDCDHKSDNCRTNRYGNTLSTLRAFDMPGVDVIWCQIGYSENGRCVPEGMTFFPRMASSAARQLGHSRCVSESLAVYGAHVTPELIRHVVNYQAVRGISLFNLMVISYDRKTAMPLQYRPNFIKENPSMDRLSAINEYTARLSHILEESRAVIDTALYYPARTICAGGELGKRAEADFERLGHYLEEKGVSFDIIDEELVMRASVIEGELTDKEVTYKNVFIPEGELEPSQVLEKLSGISHELHPCIERESAELQARRVVFENGDEGYFICNSGGEAVTETVGIHSDKHIYRVDLSDGELYTVEHSTADCIARVPLSLLRSEGIFLLLCEDEREAKAPTKTEPVCQLDGFSSFASRTYSIEVGVGMKNDFQGSGELRHGLYEWDAAFSGEVTYTCELPSLDEGDYVLDLGEVRYTAVAYIDGKKIGEATMPPYRIPFHLQGGNRLTLSIANTAANACANTDYFEKTDIRDVGPYHAKMVLWEEQEKGGGLLGPVTLEKACR